MQRASEDSAVQRPHRPNSSECQNILMFAFYYPPLNESGALRPYRFSKYLREFGYDTHVITASNPEGSEVVSTYVPASLSGLVGAGISILQRIAPYNDQLSWVPVAVRTALQQCARNQIKAVLSTSPPLATHLAAAWIKRKTGIPWVADLRDPITSNPFRPGLRAKGWDWAIEHMIVREANAIIANTDASFQALRKRHPKFEHKFHLIWNGYDPDEELVSAPVPAKSHKVLVHTGSIYGGRHPGVLLHSIDRLMQSRRLMPNDIRIRLIGFIDYAQPWIAESGFRRMLNEPWLNCIDKVIPRVDAQQELTSADYLLLLDVNGNSATVQLPAKLFEYIRVQRPILAFTTPGSPADNILRNSGVSHTCIYPEMSTEQIDLRIEKFLRLCPESPRPSAWFEQQFDGRAQTKALSNILGSCTSLI